MAEEEVQKVEERVDAPAPAVAVEPAFVEPKTIES